jgi:hypothetical protein
MASTFSPSLRLELIGDGDQSGIWGQTTNNNLGGLIEQAIGGVVTISMVDANYTLSNFNGVVDEARNAVIVATGALSQQRNIIAPLVEKTYSIQNNTTGGFAVQVIGPSGTGVIIPNGSTVLVYCNGTNFLPLSTAASGNFRVAGNLAVTGTTALTGALTASTATFSGAITSTSPAFSGIPTATTASAGTNTTQIATTAFVQNTIGSLSLGTMATQNANNVNISGGAINNVSGSSPSLSVGFSSSSGAVAWSNVSGRPYPTTSDWQFIGQSGQPAWLWGTNDGGSMRVWNPSNFNVNSANFATTAGTANALNAGNSYNVASLTASGNITAFSDERLKSDIQTFSNALATVGALRGVSFIKDGKAQVGVIAQEVQKVLPQVVQENDNSYLSVAYGNIVGVLIEAVKELKAEVEELKRSK